MAKKKAAKKRKSAKKTAKKPAAKPAAAPRRKKKESNKFLVWAVVVVVIVILLFLIRGVKKAPEAPEAEEVAPEVPVEVEEEAPPVDEDAVPETAPGEALVEEGDLESGDYSKQSLTGNPQYKDAELGKDLTAEPERFSNFECGMDDNDVRHISLKVTNTNSEVPFMISETGIQKGYNTYFMLNALIDNDGTGCGVEQLAPGESTVCKTIGLDGKVMDGINRLTIQSPNDGGKTVAEAVVVNCEE
ncbi:hypothetical protein ACFL96_15605 [Thermoproteota archaeon]